LGWRKKEKVAANVEEKNVGSKVGVNYTGEKPGCRKTNCIGGGKDRTIGREAR